MATFWRISGLVSLAFVVAGSTMVGGRYQWFIDGPSLLLVFGVVGMGLLAAFGPVGIMNAFTGCLTDREDEDPARRAEQIDVFERGYQLSWGAGFVGTLLGMILMLQNMDDPSMIGPGMATSLLTLLYGAALAEFGFNVLRKSSARNGGTPVTDDAAAPPTRSRNMVAVGAAGTFAIVAMFFIMLVSFSPIETNQPAAAPAPTQKPGTLVQEADPLQDTITATPVAFDG